MTRRLKSPGSNPESDWPGEDAVAVASPAQGLEFIWLSPRSVDVRYSHLKDPKSHVMDVKDVKDVKGG